MDDAIESAAGSHWVEVAIDAAGAGGARPYTYSLPPDLASVEPGEAVLVEFGRRQALAIVLAKTSAGSTAGRSTAGRSAAGVVKPVSARVRTDGPLLPALTLELARHIAAHYLAPPALVIRSMLPPGLLERLELVVERTPPSMGQPADTVPLLPTTEPDPDRADPGAAHDAATEDILEQLGAGPRPARDLAAPDGRAGLM
ncbi:MAG: hypothetical protein WKF56_10785, partial [Candidatus Limnocylindrales bacterium]